MMCTGITVMSLDRRGPTADQLAFTGVWQSSGGSGQRAFVTFESGTFQLHITDSQHAVLMSCAKGNMLNGCVIFTSISQECSADGQSWPCVKIERSGDTITIDGYGPCPIVFQRAQPS